jgi:AraC family transcriptional regulator
VDPAFPELTIQLALKANTGFRWNYGEGWSRRGTLRTGDWCVTPPSTEIRYECAGDHTVLIAACPESAVASLLAEYGMPSVHGLAALTEQVLNKDATVRTALLQLWDQSARHGEASALMIDGLWQVLVARLMQLAGKPFVNRRYGLTPAQLTRLDEFLAAHLEFGINTTDLAQLVGRSPTQFTRDFKQATGISPHSHVLNLRVERARELMVQRQLSLSEIAFECGFASQSHMNGVFRDKLGVTPGQYRTTVIF